MADSPESRTVLLVMHKVYLSKSGNIHVCMTTPHVARGRSKHGFPVQTWENFKD